MAAGSSTTEGDDGNPAESGEEFVLLRAPRDGVPETVASVGALQKAAEALAAGDGPVAIDAERASGYRYTQRAYLVQLRRAGAGTVLIDPIACPDLACLDTALTSAEWVLHAASQDLPCLAELGMRPRQVFDTELAGRLLGHPRVALATMLERMLGVTLEKGHGAADWSTRPLPADWITYAALDVELLVDLRDALVVALTEAGKLEWARQEFAAVVAAPPPRPRSDPWRRTSGIHRVRTRRQLAAVRGLWQSRDELAAERDVAPGRVLRDSAIIDIVTARPGSLEVLRRLPALNGRSQRGNAARWWAAFSEAMALPDSALPEHSAVSEGPPPTNRWASRDPAAATRLAGARARLATLSADVRVPVENLAPPDAVRRLAWSPPDPATDDTVGAELAQHGARPWQVTLLARPLSAALSGTEPAPA